MRCPFCHSEDLRVNDSRNVTEGNSIKRRRECLSCKKRFTTFENIDLTMQVCKRDGSYEDFQLKKLIGGLDSACRHTRVSHVQVRKLATEIVQEIFDGQVKEMNTIEIGQCVMNRLKNLDPIAYVRFACVYKRFKDKDELMNAIDDMASIGG